MKKVLSLVLLLGALAGTASAAPYYMTQPAPGALTPYDWQPVYSIEGLYNWTAKDKMPDTAGARLNLSLYNNAYSTVRHQFTISAAYECGREHDTAFNTTLEELPITLAYDINLGITDSVMLDFGVRGGYEFGFITTKGKEGLMKDYKDTLNTGGFTYSLTAGIKVQCTETIYMKLAYEFTRTFFTEDLPSHCTFNQHGIVFGIGCTF